MFRCTLGKIKWVREVERWRVKERRIVRERKWRN
jgi:hypothetical protein